MAQYVDGRAILPLRDYLDLGDIALGTYRHLALDALAARGEPPAVQLPLDPALGAALGLPTSRPP